MEEEIVQTTTDAKAEVTKAEARRILKETGGKVTNGEVDSFVSLKDINKIYPNGVQAVYDFNIEINPHDFIVLVGPSGCGKSTTLRMVAGLEPITSGYLYIDKVLSNYLPSKDRDISMVFQSYALYPSMTVYDNIAFPLRVRLYRKPLIAAKLKAADEIKRVYFSGEDINDELLETFKEIADKNLRFGTVAEYIGSKYQISDLAAKYLSKFVNLNKEELQQKASLVKTYCEDLKRKDEVLVEKKGYTLAENYKLLKDGEQIFYNAKLTKSEIREKVFNAARVLDLGLYLDRKPAELSGGQMQRVALGRAIVRDAKLFLMDEPLSNLDAKLRVAMRSEIVRLHEAIGATTIYVTHDQTEAMTMATKIAVMSKGWVQQIGKPADIYNNPNNIFVATFIGAPAMNIIKANYDNGLVIFPNGYAVTMSDAFKKKHNSFYKASIENIKRMLDTDDFKKLHAITIYDELVKLPFEEKEAINGKVDEIEAIIKTLTNNDDALVAVAEVKAHAVDEKDGMYKKAMAVLKTVLLDLKEISSADLALLHNATVFTADPAKNKADTFVYDKRKKKKKKNKVSFRVHNLTFEDNLYLTAVDLLAKHEYALKNPHEINFGVRPEFIHIDKEFANEKKSKAFSINADVVELMGQELLIHSKWNDVDLISKISTGTYVTPHTKVNVSFDMEKVHLFDVATGNRID